MSIPESVATGPGNEPAAPFALARILVIDDETVVCRALSAILKADGYEVVTAQSGKDALERLRGQHFELAIADLVMPEMDGIQTMAALRGLDPDIEFVVLTGHAGVESAVAALKLGASDYLLKPINIPQLRAAVTRALERRLSTGLALYEASRTLLATLERREPILAVLELGQGAMRATTAGLALVPPEGTGLQVDLSRGDGRLGEGAVKRLAQEAMQAHEALRDPFFEVGHPHNGEAGIPAGSILAFPLQVRNATLGALVLWRDKGVAPFAIWEQRRGKILAAEIAIALDNARLSRELSRKAEELAAAQSKVARAEAHARAIVDTAREAILLFDKEGVVWDLNPKALEMFGRSRGETVGQNLAEFAIPPRLRGAFRKHVEKVYRAGRDPVEKCMELMALRKNGQEFPLELLTTLVETPQGTLLSTFARDITERKRAEQRLRESEAKYRTLLENLPQKVFHKNQNFAYVACNENYARDLGIEPQEITGKTDYDFYPKELAEKYRADDARILRSGHIEEFDEGYIQDGEHRIVHTVKVPLRDDQGTPSGILGIFWDITEKKRVEEALQNASEMVRAVIRASPVAIFTLAPDGTVRMWNPTAEQMFGWTEHEVLGRPLPTVPEERQEEFKALRERVIRGESISGVELHRRRRDGSWIDVSLCAAPLRDATGQSVGLLGMLTDITERKQAEEALIEEKHLLHSLMDNLPDHIYFKDLHSRFKQINIAHARSFGLSDPAQAVGKTDFDFHSAEHARQAYTDEQEVIRTGQPMLATEQKVTRPDGRETWASTTKMPLRDAQGHIIGTFGVSRDITDRKRAEQALRASEERYRELFENASELVFTADLETSRLTSLNRVAEQTFGYSREEAVRMEFQRLIDPRHWHRIGEARAQLLTGESAFTLELEIRAKDGRRAQLEVKPRLIYKEGKPVEVQVIGHDITGREAAEMELRHAQKLEAVGRLASGIAHEINTPIQFLGDNTRFLQDSFAGLQTVLSKYQALRDAAASGAVSPDLLAEVRRVEEESDCAYLLEEIPKALAQTLDGVTRVATIVRAMKDFAHPESKKKAATDLNKALLSTLTVARNELKYVADVETDLGELPPVVCNISDLNQVFLNLLVNAAHAIGEVVKGTGKKGKIRVRTVAEDKRVLITIADTGCGIPEGLRSKVFDPFFTTKDVGRGTGQGLAIAHSVVVERHKGSLTFESEVGKGTTFYVRLPIDCGEPPEETKVP